MALSYAIMMVRELCHGEGFRSMKRDALQGQSSLKNVWSATEYDSCGAIAPFNLTLFSRTYVKSAKKITMAVCFSQEEFWFGG